MTFDETSMTISNGNKKISQGKLIEERIVGVPIM